MDNAFDERAKKAVDAASDLAKQLITLATGVIAITISFAKDVFGGRAGGNDLLVASWAAYLCCITFGVWVLMAIAGTLDPAKPTESKGSGGSFLGSNVRTPATLQIVSFIVATALVAIAAVLEARTAH